MEKAPVIGMTNRLAKGKMHRQSLTFTLGGFGKDIGPSPYFMYLVELPVTAMSFPEVFEFGTIPSRKRMLVIREFGFLI